MHNANPSPLTPPKGEYDTDKIGKLYNLCARRAELSEELAHVRRSIQATARKVTAGNYAFSSETLQVSHLEHKQIGWKKIVGVLVRSPGKLQELCNAHTTTQKLSIVKVYK